MSIKNVVSVVLAMCGRKMESASSVDILSGYVKLLCVDENKLDIYLSSPEEKADVMDAKAFFAQQKVDLELLKQGLIFFKAELNLAQGNNAWKELSAKLEQQENLSSLEILNQLVIALGLKLVKFKNKKQLSDIIGEDKTDAKKRSFNTAGTPSQLPNKGEEQQVNPAPDALRTEEPVRNKTIRLQDLSQQSKALRLKLFAEMGNQSKPIIDFVDGILYNDILDSSRDFGSARACFLFVGPDGVGKGTLIKKAAEALNVQYKLYNAGNFRDAKELYGTARDGYGLHSFVSNNPNGIIAFDNIERIVPEVFVELLEAWKAGKTINPNLGKELDFSNNIIIFLTNKYPSSIADKSQVTANYSKKDLLELYKNEEEESLTILRILATQLEERELILFNNISLSVIREVFNRHLDTIVKNVKERYGLNLVYDERLLLLLLLSKGKFVDRDSAISNCEAFIREEFCELSKQLESHKDLLEGVENLQLSINLQSEDTDKDILSLFDNNYKSDLLVICSDEDKELFKNFKDYNITFASNSEELNIALNKEYELVLLDLKLGLKQNYGVSLDDADSFGVKAFELLKDTGMPIYMLDSKGDLSDTDKNHYLQKGAAGSIKGTSSRTLKAKIKPIAFDIFLENRIHELFRKRYILEYNTAQIKNGNVLTIEYHSLKKQQIINALGQGKLLSDAERPDTKFADVIGAQNAKEELQYFIKYLSNPRRFIKEGGKPAKGVLLYGPPGTGKTMLARAMAGESGVNFIQTTANNFKSSYHGDSEKNVRELFALARSSAPAIIFIDEIDAIGKNRTGRDPHTESILNTLLTEMDGFKIDLDNPVFVLAATNFDVNGPSDGVRCLDPALERRFDNKICVDLPNEKEREEFIKLMAAKNKFTNIKEEIIHNVASRTLGQSLAILQNIMDLAFRNAQKHKRKPNGEDLLNALEEYQYGERTDASMDHYKSTAIHEAGHAYIYYLSGNTPTYMTIEARGDHLGYMQLANDENKAGYTKDELIWRIRCSLGGRASEMAFFGEKAALNTGASQDLRNATQMAIRIICDYGMIEGNLLAIPFEVIKTTPLVEKYLMSANDLLQQEMAATLTLVQNGKSKIEKLSNELLKKYHLSGEEIKAILDSEE